MKTPRNTQHATLLCTTVPVPKERLFYVVLWPTPGWARLGWVGLGCGLDLRPRARSQAAGGDSSDAGGGDSDEGGEGGKGGKAAAAADAKSAKGGKKGKKVREGGRIYKRINGIS